jgi:hypothetical protein
VNQLVPSWILMKMAPELVTIFPGSQSITRTWHSNEALACGENHARLKVAPPSRDLLPMAFFSTDTWITGCIWLNSGKASRYAILQTIQNREWRIEAECKSLVHNRKMAHHTCFIEPSTPLGAR